MITFVSDTRRVLKQIVLNITKALLSNRFYNNRLLLHVHYNRLHRMASYSCCNKHLVWQKFMNDEIVVYSYRYGKN